MTEPVLDPTDRKLQYFEPQLRRRIIAAMSACEGVSTVNLEALAPNWLDVVKKLEADILALRSARPEALRSGWVSVTDSLPKENEHVLLFFGGAYRPVREGYLSRMTYNDETGKDFDLPLFVDATQWYGEEGSPDEVQVTHWMPLASVPSPLARRGDET